MFGPVNWTPDVLLQLLAPDSATEHHPPALCRQIYLKQRREKLSLGVDHKAQAGAAVDCRNSNPNGAISRFTLITRPSISSIND